MVAGNQPMVATMSRQRTGNSGRVGEFAAGHGLKSYLALRRFLWATSGVTSVEYAMLLVCIMAVALSAVQVLGDRTLYSFNVSMFRMRAAGLGE